MGAGNSNFGFLLADWPDLAQHASRAEQFTRIDPRASMFYSRYTAERLVEWLYTVEPALVLPYKDDLCTPISWTNWASWRKPSSPVHQTGT